MLKGGYMEGRILTAAEAQALATLESREVMLSKIAGIMKTEMSRAASMFQALQSRFLGVLEAYKEKLTPEEPRRLPTPRPAPREPERRGRGSRGELASRGHDGRSERARTRPRAPATSPPPKPQRRDETSEAEDLRSRQNEEE